MTLATLKRLDELRAAAERAKLELLARAAEGDLRAFLRGFWDIIVPHEPVYAESWAVDAVCDHLMGVTAGHIRQLVINIPPRFLKSTTSCVAWPAWEWGPRRLPHLRNLYVSYARDLSIRDSVYCRRLIESPRYRTLWGDIFELTTDQNVKSRFDNDRGGFRIAGSFGSGLTGEGGHKIVCDDPHELKDADNFKAIERTIDIWQGEIESRLNDRNTGQRVIVMQRVAENDLSAHVLKAAGWVHLRLPNEYNPKRKTVTLGSARPGTVTLAKDKKTGKTRRTTALVAQRWEDPRTTEGELLNPVRLTPDETAKMKAPTGLGLRKYTAQYNQNPQSSAGIIFERSAWKFWRVLPAKFDSWLLSLDSAFKGNEDSDHVVATIWGRLGAEFYLVHLVRDQLSFTDTVTLLQNLATLYPKARKKLIEDTANGPAIIDTLKKKVSGLIPVNPEGGKVARAWAVQPYQQAGNIYLPDYFLGCATLVEQHDADGQPILDPDTKQPILIERPYDASWVPGFIEECATFRGIDGQADDQVDSMTQALIHLTTAPTPRVRSLRD